MNYEEFEQKTHTVLMNANIRLSKLHSNQMGIMNTGIRMEIIEQVINDLDDLWQDHFDVDKALKENVNVVKLSDAKN